MQTTLTIEKEAVSIVKSSLALKHKALEFNRHQYMQRLTVFEKRHKMTSGQFIKKFKKGELGDDPEWFDWEFVLDTFQETVHQLELLESVKL